LSLKNSGEKGFSLLIKEAGLYTLKGKLIGIGKSTLLVCAYDTACRENKAAGAFFAKYPVVFRNHKKGDLIFKYGRKRRLSDILNTDVYTGYTGIITVNDIEGPVAFICAGRDVCVVCRDNGTVASTDDSLFEVSVR